MLLNCLQEVSTLLKLFYQLISLLDLFDQFQVGFDKSAIVSDFLLLQLRLFELVYYLLFVEYLLLHVALFSQIAFGLISHQSHVLQTNLLIGFFQFCFHLLQGSIRVLIELLHHLCEPERLRMHLFYRILNFS